MNIQYAQRVTVVIPDRLTVRIPAGETITQIDHSCDGAAAVMDLALGFTDNENEATHLNLAKIATLTKGGHQAWSGAIKADRLLYVKGWLRSVAVGGSHNLVVLTDAQGGGSRTPGAAIGFVASPAVIVAPVISKGLVLTLNAAVGHDLQVVSFQVAVVCDATVATRTLTLRVYDAASGAGNIIGRLFQGSFTASDSKTFMGGISQPSSFNGNDNAIQLPGQGLIIPASGSMAAAETNFVAGDSWSVRIVYRDIPVDLML